MSVTISAELSPCRLFTLAKWACHEMGNLADDGRCDEKGARHEKRSVVIVRGIIHQTGQSAKEMSLSILRTFHCLHEIA